MANKLKKESWRKESASKYTNVLVIVICLLIRTNVWVHLKIMKNQSKICIDVITFLDKNGN